MYLITSNWTRSVSFCLDSLLYLGCDHQAFQFPVSFEQIAHDYFMFTFFYLGKLNQGPFKTATDRGRIGEYEIAFCLMPTAELLCPFIC